MEKRVVIRIMFDKLPLDKLAEVAEAIETLAAKYGRVEVETTVLPDRPGL